jgi:aryl-alcohol dehydrogenase-like predicted oxidoreductase
MARLCWAQALVGWVPFERWRGTLGFQPEAEPSRRSLEVARGLAADVEWAARRLPHEVKCLPKSMALSWMLRRRQVAHAVVIAVRPDQLRQSPDALHAWVEVRGARVIGDLPGPWIETLRLGRQIVCSN